MVSGHKSKIHIATFFLNILLIKMSGIALKIGDGQKRKTSVDFFPQKDKKNPKK